MRPVQIKAHVNPYAEGSAICAFGRTEVLCTASLENKVPRWMEDDSRGWVTAEYAMLPRSTHTRTSRDHRNRGRAQEISRLIGRSLRAAVDLESLVGHTVKVDCDVMVADGGTRTASITGGYVALALALKTLDIEPMFPVAAVSCGKVDGQVVVDLCYEEDSTAEVDLNLVLAPGGRLVEVQSTAEQGFFSTDELGRMVALGEAAAEELFALQTTAIKGA
jgi:ribonuclease PH